MILGQVTNATSVGGFRALDDDIVKMDDGLNELILVKAPKVLADYNALVGSLIARDFRPVFPHSPVRLRDPQVPGAGAVDAGRRVRRRNRGGAGDEYSKAHSNHGAEAGKRIKSEKKTRCMKLLMQRVLRVTSYPSS